MYKVVLNATAGIHQTGWACQICKAGRGQKAHGHLLDVPSQISEERDRSENRRAYACDDGRDLRGMKQKSPSERTNDLHHYRRESLSPASRLVQRIAGKIKTAKIEKPKTGKGSGRKTGALAGASRRWTAEQVFEMRRRRKAGERISDLAREFGVHYVNMEQILDGRNYSWVPDPK